MLDIKRFVEITEEINQLLAPPMPPPAEKHLLREKIFALKLEQLALAGDMTDRERDQAARDFTLAKVPQRLASYPMHLREVVMPVTTEAAELAEKRRQKRQIDPNGA